MFTLSRIFTLTFVSVTCASRIGVRQATNTNAQILEVVDSVDSNLRHVGPAILRLQANHSLSDVTLAEQLAFVGAAFTAAELRLQGIPVSSGSTKVRLTNDDISLVYADAMQ
ncbi:hypothetical protein C8J57DRAFT_1079423 [Mycena rebaudengoi]|nr:hypothetical protein C8J57DRAFT_1079423 [Mycena rebaudengoi]